MSIYLNVIKKYYVATAYLNRIEFCLIILQYKKQSYVSVAFYSGYCLEYQPQALIPVTQAY